MSKKPDQKKRDFLRLRNRVIKVYPYAKALKQKLDSIDIATENLSKRKKRKQLKKVKKELFKEFGERIKNLYTKDGVILIKLIHKETGETASDLLKEYTSSLNTFFWKSIVTGHNINPRNKTKIKLKTRYDPVNNKDDCCIEKILNKPGRYLDIY